MTLWTPTGPGFDDFVDNLHRTIAECGESPFVEVELVDGARLAIESIAAEPGHGFVTLRPHPRDEAPGAVVVPVGSIRRIDVSRSREEERPLGFTLPSARP
jgi:hypothetical protein